MTAELLAESDRRDRELQRQIDAERAAYQAGYDDGYARGRADEWDEWRVGLGPAREAARYGARNPGFAELERMRWAVRGERRTRATFGQPHALDYPGKRGAA